MKRIGPILLLLTLLLASGCAQWSPFVKNSKFQRVWGYPPRVIGQALHIPTMDQLRVEDFQDKVDR
jgi:hypothetical protein